MTRNKPIIGSESRESGGAPAKIASCCPAAARAKPASLARKMPLTLSKWQPALKEQPLSPCTPLGTPRKGHDHECRFLEGVVDRPGPGAAQRADLDAEKNGYRVFPALDLQQAKQRCKPGAYDLIVVNSGEQPETALEFCEWIRGNDPKQTILLMVGAIVQLPRREYMVPDIPERLLERIDSIFERANTVPKAA